MPNTQRILRTGANLPPITSSKDKWIVHINGNKITDPDDEEYEGFEISVLLKSNAHGQRSWGWPGLDKIVLFESDEIEEEDASENWDLMLRQAEAIALALNKVT